MTERRVRLPLTLLFSLSLLFRPCGSCRQRLRDTGADSQPARNAKATPPGICRQSHRKSGATSLPVRRAATLSYRVPSAL